MLTDNFPLENLPNELRVLISENLKSKNLVNFSRINKTQLALTMNSKANQEEIARSKVYWTEINSLIDKTNKTIDGDFDEQEYMDNHFLPFLANFLGIPQQNMIAREESGYPGEELCSKLITHALSFKKDNDTSLLRNVAANAANYLVLGNCLREIGVYYENLTVSEHSELCKILTNAYGETIFLNTFHSSGLSGFNLDTKIFINKMLPVMACLEDRPSLKHMNHDDVTVNIQISQSKC